MSVRIEVFKGEKTLPYIHTHAEMCIKACRHFPYLYMRSVEEELVYKQGYSMSQGLLIIAFKRNTLIGTYSGMPMNTPIDFLEQWSKKLIEEGIDISNCFYAGELVVKSPFQKQGIGTQLMQRLLQEVREMGFKTIMGVTSIRSFTHPLRPQNYFDTDQLWEKYGFKKTPIVFSRIWPTLQEDGTIKEEENELACWINALP